MKNKFLTFNKIINKLNNFWKKNGCVILQPIDMEVGAATFHPTTFFNAINKKNWKAAYTQICRRPTDNQYSEDSNRLPIFHQYQVIIKPSYLNIQKLYLDSLRNLNIEIDKNDIKFIEDNWESPTLGAAGIGWEVWLNGTEITQFTYFQTMGGIECNPIMVELAYGIERIAMYLQNTFNINEIIFEENKHNKIFYHEIYNNYTNEIKNYITNEIDTKVLVNNFNSLEYECKKLIKKKMINIAYENIIKISNIFNLLDAKLYLSTTERKNYILKIRILSNDIAKIIKNEK